MFLLQRFNINRGNPGSRSRMPIRAARAIGLLMAVFLTQGFFCSDPEHIHMSDVEITSLSLAVRDTLRQVPGAMIVWRYESDNPERLSHFDLFLKVHPDSQETLELGEIPARLRSLLVAFPDTSLDVFYYGLNAVYLSPEGQRWQSDSIRFESLGISTPVTDLQPPLNAREDLIKTTFSLRCANDAGETYRLLAFQEINPGRWAVTDTTFPFTGSGQVVFRTSTIRDSIQFPVLDMDSSIIRWCILATEAPGRDPTNLRQSLTCSRYVKLRPR